MNFYNILNVHLRVLPGEIIFVQINTHYVGGEKTTLLNELH